MKKKAIKIAIGALALSMIFAGSFYAYASNTSKTINALGYSDEETEQFIEEHGIFNAYENVEKALEDEIKQKEELLITTVGVSPELIENYNTLTRVEYSNALDVFTESTKLMYEENIAEVEKKLSVFTFEEETSVENLSLSDIYNIKHSLLVETEDEYNEKINEHKQSLLDYGMRESELESLLNGSLVEILKALGDKVAYYKEYNALVSTSGNSYASGSMDLFNRLNEHRVSKGLAPFEYNAAQQGCVDIEANSYANNKNPHNWLCKTLTSEGASLASVNSDYIKIAGDFLTSHGSHEADVTNPRYTSAACSAVARDGMVYMICGYFK